MSESGSQELAVVPPQTAITARPRKRKWRRAMFLILMTGLLGGASWGLQATVLKTAPAELLTCRVTTGEFVHEVTERGELESSANLEVRCEVESRDGKGMKILQIVPEGTVVKEGDLLFKLDDSGLRSERTAQQIAVNAAESAATQARNELEAAEFAKREYELGTFVQDEEKAESELFVARENLQRAEGYLKHSRKLEARGYSSAAATEADAFAVEKCRKELGVAETKLKVLREYTKAKTLKKLEADIKNADAKLKSEQAKFELEGGKLAKIDAQLGKCVVVAPRPGQVVYDHEQDNWRGEDYMIKEGSVVYERRVVIRLPEPTKMQVKAKVAESKIDRLKVDMPASITIEGLNGMVLKGKVTKVNDYPAQGNWFNQAVKEYETVVQVVDAPPGLRPGMSAQVAIRVESLPDAMQVPVQAIAEINGHHYCLVRERDESLKPRTVTLGSSNDKFLVIRDGVKKDEELLLDPRAQLLKLTLPASAEPAAAAPVAASSDASKGAKPAPADGKS
jgi:multidrug efflux pump subunit AcrA (membrane-fusion protein)